MGIPPKGPEIQLFMKIFKPSDYPIKSECFCCLKAFHILTLHIFISGLISHQLNPPLLHLSLLACFSLHGHSSSVSIQVNKDLRDLVIYHPHSTTCLTIPFSPCFLYLYTVTLSCGYCIDLSTFLTHHLSSFLSIYLFGSAGC